MGKLRDRIKALARRAPRMRTLNALVIVLASILALLSLQTSASIAATQEQQQRDMDTFVVCVGAAKDLEENTTFLTMQADLFVLTGKRSYLENYTHNVVFTKKGEAALQTLRDNLVDAESLAHLEAAMENLNTLALQEHHALTLMASAHNYWLGQNLDAAYNVALSHAERVLSPENKEQRAYEILFDRAYQQQRREADENLALCVVSIMEQTRITQETTSQRLRDLQNTEHLLILALLVVVVAIIMLVIFLVLWPLASYIERINHHEPLPQAGAFELRFLSRAYDAMFEEIQQRQAHLLHVAEHDGLTGLLNRGAYELLSAQMGPGTALVLFDVDLFKLINDGFGHEVGDAILRRVATTLTGAFRSGDHVCRIGGDEFAVIMTGIDGHQRGVVQRRVAHVQRELRRKQDDLPQVTLSMGAAFFEDARAGESIFNAADRALYAVKESGRNGFAFASDVDAAEKR